MSDYQSTGSRADGKFPSDSYGNEGQGSFGVQPSDSSVTQGGYGGREDGRVPASSYGSNTSDNSATRDTGREDGRFNSDSYSKEGSGSYGVQPSSTSVDEGSLGGRQDGRFPASSYSTNTSNNSQLGSRADARLPSESFRSGAGSSTTGAGYSLEEGSKGGRQDGRFPESSYSSSSGYEHSRAEGGVPQQSYAGEGQGALSGATRSDDGALQGRYDSKQSTDSSDNSSGGGLLDQAANMASKIFGNPK